LDYHSDFNPSRHPFHIVNPSPWPFFIARWLPINLIHLLEYLHTNFFQIIYKTEWFYKIGYIFSPSLSFILLIAFISRWFYDIVVEATFEGQHTLAIQKNLRIGIILFIISEIIFFIAFFSAFFYLSVNPSIWIGNVWPPLGILPLYTWSIPLLNTIILLSSGIAITATHHSLIYSRIFAKSPDTNLFKFNTVKKNFRLTLYYGCLFTYFQYYEYTHALFTIADSIYGATFFIITGLHGLHVIIGTIFLFVQYLRLRNYHFSAQQHLGFEIAIWYWHFVDVVWLFVFTFIYWWSNHIFFNP